MRTPLRLALPVAAALATLAPSASAATAAAVREPVPHTAPAADSPSYIVTVHRGFDPAAVAALAGVTPDHVYRHTLNGFSAHLTPEQLAALTAEPGVASVAADGTASGTEAGTGAF
ncbi:protease inhibitor I9 family protein [Streptomyces sp. NPDC089915]|uniref:protease inhibitor I9 family protein n=1 Tax=Streptomyces sp. NPDC089915 TaxID=3155186 RepID=UPI00342E0291